MNNEISSKSLSLSSVDASLAAIIPDTPIVSIAGSTLSEITTTTTSTTTTPTPTPTSYESNKVEISSLSGPSIPSMSGVSPKIAGAATLSATASSNTSTTTTASADNSATATTNSNAINLNHANNNPTQTVATSPNPAADASGSGSTATGATKKLESVIATGKTKPETNAAEEKLKDLDEHNLKSLLEEAISYRSPTDKTNKSELFLSLLKKAENEKEDTISYRMPTSSRVLRNSYTTHTNHHQQHHRHKHGGSLQDLDEAVRNESILDPEYFFGNTCGQRNRRHNHNSRQKKYSSSVSSRQREGGSLPNNVNVTNCARLFGIGGGTAGGDVAGVQPIELQFPFTHEINPLASAAKGAVSNLTGSGSASGSANTSGNSNINNNSNNIKPQRRNAARSNTMSSISVTATSTSSSSTENEQLIGQPIGVLIGGQVIMPKSISAAVSIGNNNATCNDTANGNGSNVGTTANTTKSTICNANPGKTINDCVIEMGETIIEVQQQQQIYNSKTQEAISRGRPYYDRVENVEVLPRSNMMRAVPSKASFGPTTANAYVDEKIYFGALAASTYNTNSVTVSGGSKTGQVANTIDSKYLPLGDDYKATKSVLREVDENGNAVSEIFQASTTHAAVTSTAHNSINIAAGPALVSAAANIGGLSQPSVNATTTSKGKSKKQPKQERNVTTVNLEKVAGYRGTDPVEKLVEYIESTTNDDTKNSKPKKERKKQEKHNKIKKSNSLEELRSGAKMEVEELKRTAATTESNVMMRSKGNKSSAAGGSGGKHNSASAADINKNFENSGSGNINKTANNVVSTAASTTPNAATNAQTRKGERRSWGTEELQYLGGDANAGNSNRNSHTVAINANSEEKVATKDKKANKKLNEDKTEKGKTDNNNATVLMAGTANTVEKPDKRKKSETKSSATNDSVDILAIESEFHVVTKKKKAKKQRNSLEEPNNGSKSHTMGSTGLSSKSSNTAGQHNVRYQNNNNNGSNHYQQQQHHNNHYHNQQQHQQQQQHQHQQQHQQQQQNNDKSRRKSTSSVPPSEKSDSSDLDSVHSLPVEKAAKLAAGAQTKAQTANAGKNTSRTQNKNTAAYAAASASPTLNFQPKTQPSQQPNQQMPTPFSYAEIAKEAKTFSNSNNIAIDSNTSSFVSVPDQNNAVSANDEVKQNTLTHSQQSTTARQTSGTVSPTANIATTPTNATGPSAANSTHHNSNTTTTTTNNNNGNNPPVNKTNSKSKKSAPKADFPALGSASDVAVAASAARADVFAKAVLNSAQQTTTNVQQNVSSNENIDIPSPQKEASQPNIQTMHHQQQQPLQKSKSIEQETSSISSNSSVNSSSNNFNNPMDHQQYPALKTVKRQGASHFTTTTTVSPPLPPSTLPVATTRPLTYVSTVITTSHQYPNFNFAAAARQMALAGNSEIPMSAMMMAQLPPLLHQQAEATTTPASASAAPTTSTTATTTLNTKKNSSATAKEKLTATSNSVNTATPTSASNETGSKKHKKEKQTSMDGNYNKANNSARKTTSATQTTIVNHNNDTTNNLATGEIDKQQVEETISKGNVKSNTATGMSNSSMQAHLMAANRPAVIILNDDAAGSSTDFTFGDFNEDELHFFDDGNEDYGSPMTTEQQQALAMKLSPKLTASSPRSNVNSMQLLNDSGACTELGSMSNNSGIQFTANADELILLGNSSNASDTTLSPNNSTLNAADMQINNGSAVSQNNHSGDSGIYTATAATKHSLQEKAVETGTFMQQTESFDNDNDDEDETLTDNSMKQPRQQQQLECNEIETAIIAAARRAATQQYPQYTQQQEQQQQHHHHHHNKKPTAIQYQHSNSNSSSFSSSSSVDGVTGANRYYTTAQSPPPPPHQVDQSQQQQKPHYFIAPNGRQTYAPGAYSQQQQLPSQYYHPNYSMLPNSQQPHQQQQQHMVMNAPRPMMSSYSRNNSECDEDYITPPLGSLVVRIQNKEFDLHYLPPNASVTCASQNDFIVDYVASVWDEVVNSQDTKMYDE